MHFCVSGEKKKRAIILEDYDFISITSFDSVHQKPVKEENTSLILQKKKKKYTIKNKHTRRHIKHISRCGFTRFGSIGKQLQ